MTGPCVLLLIQEKKPAEEILDATHTLAPPVPTTERQVSASGEMLVATVTVFLNAGSTLLDIELSCVRMELHAKEKCAFLPIMNMKLEGQMHRFNNSSSSSG
jgi:hypothetical protein